MPRSWGDLTEEEKDTAVAQYLTASYGGVDYEALDLEHSTSTERRIRYRAQHLPPPIPISQTPQYTLELLRIKGNALIVGDLEIPDHSAEVLELARAVGKKQGIKTLIINGDTVAADGLSNHPIGARSPATTAQEDVQLARKVITSLADWFSHIYVVSGNHCRRLRWGTRGEFTADFLLSDLPGVVTTPYSRMYLTSNKQEWLICHPKNYSKVPGALARDIAEIENVNVVAAHTHLLSFSITKDGRHSALDGGHCRDVTRTLYKVENTTRHPAWCAGFVVIRNGYGHALSLEHTDWSMWI